MSKIDKLVDKIANQQVGDCCENPYLIEFKRDNLRIYLNKVYSLKLSTLLVGEALGFKGCGQTGIPFTSEFILNSKGDGLKKAEGFKTQANTNALTCTIVHEILKVYDFTPILWNIFPFRPFRKGESITNRPPNFQEVELGLSYIEDVLDIFNITNLLAVGKIAHKALSKVYRDVTYIRHPAHGGKLDFVTGISEWTEYQNTLSNIITTL